MTFTSIDVIAIPVTDQDRALATWTSLGLTVTMDAELQPGFRWVELALPGGGPKLALVAAGPELPAGIDTGIRLATPDARAAHAAVAEHGFTPQELLDWGGGVPLMFECKDPDGNTLYVFEAP